ncbi:NAD-dependent epimerase/dehydratase family protein [Bacillus sp. CECT 9360]|uniref:NAD-dependent epimerase/dehydratase family protein n=1 Tax=Bacillus sp. CECT 9360 TaxID=2845821 RepID=UPI001E2C678C|nr:NAD-dependent epimerase/dehydratase family protein [Bacillus sp. CECT 9360]CAH0345470.1 UDP-glucose 4-epimerase [Bacillus sp. CECT 9360]
MKAVVTGGAGFIGSHLVRELISEGVTVHIIDNLASGKREQIHPRAILHVLDVQSSDVRDLIVKEQPDIVFHLAAQVDVLSSIHNPEYDAQVNILGTVNILEACRESSSVKKIIYSSSSAVYGDIKVARLTENNLTEPISYYGVSKFAPEHYLRIYHQLYGLSYTVLRYANVYGPNQTPKGEGGVVAIFLDRIKKGLPLVIHGDGGQTRDFVYVKDVVRANLCAIQQGDNEVINIGTATPTSVNQLAYTLTKLHGSKVVITHSDGRPGDIMHSCLENNKAERLLQWTPLYSINEGLQETYDFVMQEH